MTGPVSTAEPTGLDYQAAYAAMYPGLVTSGVKLSEVQDNVLKAVDRAARLRRQERERVKQVFLDFADHLDKPNQKPLDADVIADLIRRTAEEIR